MRVAVGIACVEDSYYRSISKYASEGQVDIYGAMHPAYLCYFLRSDAKTGFGRSSLAAAWRLMMLVMTAWILGASVIA